MKKGRDTSANFNDLYIVHQNLPEKKNKLSTFKEHILFLPLSGEVNLKLDDSTLACGPGHMLYLPPQISHEFSSSQHGGERIIVMFKDPHFSPAIRDPIKLSLNQLIKEVLFYLLVNSKTKMSKALVAVFKDALCEAIEANPVNDDSVEHLVSRVQDTRIKKALDLIGDNFQENINLAKIAKGSGLSSRNLSRLLHQETGLTVKQWIVAFRIELAKKLLIESKKNVTEIAYTVGYSSLSQFISAFRSRTGQLPSKFGHFG